MVVSESRDVGMDRALERARTLHTSVGVALHGYRLEPQEAAALQQVRSTIALLENKVREIKVAKDDNKKAGLLAELDPIRQQVVEQCHQHKHAVLSCQELLKEILDWCELKSSVTSKPTTYRSSVDDVQRSTDALINYSGFSSATDVSSSWVQSQAQLPQHKGSPTAATLSLTGWEHSKLRPVKTVLDSLRSNGSAMSSPSILATTLLSQQQQQQSNCTSSIQNHLKADQAPATPAAVAAGAGAPKIHQATEAARAHAAKLTAQSRSSGGGGEQQQQQGEERQQSWKGQLKEAQQLARQLRPARPFLHLDGRSEPSITSSGGSGGGSSHGLAYYSGGDTALSRYSDHRGDGGPEAESLVNSGWESVQHLRRQRSSSSLTSMDFTRAFKSGTLQDAAILSSNASRVHILHDAVAHKPHAEGELVHVPRVPACLAVHKKRRWWVRLLQILVATSGGAVAVGAAAITAAGGLEGLKKNVAKLGSAGALKSGTDSKQETSRVQQQKALSRNRVSYAPVGPAPDASIGCG